MAAIFISHSHHDDALASSLAEWLRANGFDDFYLDHESQRAGDKWTETLRHAKRSCRVVLCVITQQWLTSDDCYGEFVAGWYMGRRIIPLLTMNADSGPLEPKEQNRLNRLLLEDQGIFIGQAITPHAIMFDEHPEIAAHLNEGLRAAGALAKVGLDPSAFDIDINARREPFPGLQSFGDTDGDAALFFGRSQEIAGCLEDLRELRATGDRRAYIILGASGSGKSSLMKAGILPRIRRERGWFVPRAFRPGADPLLSFSEALATTADELQVPLSAGAIRDTLLTAWRSGDSLRDALDSVIVPLKARANRVDSTTLISFDQGEELVPAQGSDSAEALFALMRSVLDKVQQGEPSPYSLMLTFRSDSFREFENLKGLEGLDTRVQNIRALPVHRFEATITQPAARYGVHLEQQLTDALMDEAEGQDALPLLAFTLQRLWRQYKSEGVIKKSHYESIGKLSGIIEDAAERALRGLTPQAAEGAALEKVSTARDENAARVFIPALAQLNERGSVVRRTASLTTLKPEDRELVKHFARWRLISTSGDTFEVTHEAIFRKWPRFLGWLEQDKTRLETLHGVEAAATAWDMRGRKAEDLIHRGKRLAQARSLAQTERYQVQLTSNAEATAYVEACIGARRRNQFVAGGAVAATAVVVLAIAAIPALINQLAQADVQRRLDAAAKVAEAYVPNSRVLKATESARDLDTKSVFRDCEACPELVVLPAGDFSMGSPDNEPLRGSDEGPVHRVSIPKFAIGRFDVTFSEWELCVQDNACPAVVMPADYIGGKGRWPVIAISWDDANAYSAWLSKRTNQRYRLPSEAEWEYAARGATQTAYHTGPAIDHQQANFGNSVGSAQPVGAYPPNPFGLYDMSGSVWQLVEDCYNNSYETTPVDGSPSLTGDCVHRIIRGGSWFNETGQIRSAMRNLVRVSDKIPHGGFRVARSLDSP